MRSHSARSALSADPLPSDATGWTGTWTAPANTSGRRTNVLLRPVPARLGPLRAAGMYCAAETGAQIGGDLYETVQTCYGSG